MTNANSNFGKPTAQEAREQLIALGGKITSTVLEINGHCSSITLKAVPPAPSSMVMLLQ